MGEARQYRALLPEARLPGGAEEREVEELDCRLPLEAPVGAAREPHGAHPALADRALERVRPELEPGERHLERRREKAGAVRGGLAREQGAELLGEARRGGAQLLEPLRLLGGGQLECVVQERLQLPPALTVDDGHGQPP